MINFDKDGIYTYKGVNEPYKYRTTITSRQKMPCTGKTSVHGIFVAYLF